MGPQGGNEPAGGQRARRGATVDYWQGRGLRLRAVEPEDAQTFHRWNRNSERGRALDFLWPPTSLASVEAWVDAQSRRRLEDDSFHWVMESDAGEPVGSISTHHADRRNGTFGYGVDVAPEHRRRGHAREAIRLVLGYYFDELRYQKVTVPVHGDNAASIALHEALGFLREGVHRRMMYSGGRFIDVLWYGITAEEFRASFGSPR